MGLPAHPNSQIEDKAKGADEEKRQTESSMSFYLLLQPWEYGLCFIKPSSVNSHSLGIGDDQHRLQKLGSSLRHLEDIIIIIIITTKI